MSIKINKENGQAVVAGTTPEEFLQSVIEASREGYEIVPNTGFLFGIAKQVTMIDSNFVKVSSPVQEEPVDEIIEKVGAKKAKEEILEEAIKVRSKSKLKQLAKANGITITGSLKLDAMKTEIARSLGLPYTPNSVTATAS